jgi:RimJ/RimL family protein N-acetyltransferase
MASPSIALDQVEQPVLEFGCYKDQKIIHRVYPLELSIQNLERLWKIISPYKTVWGYEHLNDFWKFVSFMVDLQDDNTAKSRGLFWVMDDFAGVFFLTNIDPGMMAQFHYGFFKPLGVCKKMVITELLGYYFDKYKLHRISMEAPLYMAKHSFSFIESLGFKWEGREREARLYDGKYFHVNHYGLLVHEYKHQRGL